MKFFQLLDHQGDGVDGLLGQPDLPGEIDAANCGGQERISFGEFFDRLGNRVKGAGNGLDVLAVQRSDGGAGQQFGDLGRDCLVLAP